jgi:hypothetical protein
MIFDVATRQNDTIGRLYVLELFIDIPRLPELLWAFKFSAGVLNLP